MCGYGIAVLIFSWIWVINVFVIWSKGRVLDGSVVKRHPDLVSGAREQRQTMRGDSLEVLVSAASVGLGELGCIRTKQIDIEIRWIAYVCVIAGRKIVVADALWR